MKLETVLVLEVVYMINPSMMKIVDGSRKNVS